jgi:hypothetical protein
MACGVVECATAGYQPECRVIGRAVNCFSREIDLEVPAHAADPENSRDTIGKRHVHVITGLQRAQAEKDSRAPITVNVAFDDGRADLSWRSGVLVPRRLTSACGQRRHLKRAVRVEAQVQQLRMHANGGDVNRYRHRTLQ